MKAILQVISILILGLILLGCSCKHKIVKVYVPVYPSLEIFDTNTTKLSDLNITYEVFEVNNTKED